MMRSLILAALAAGMAIAATPSSAQTYDPSYPVCKRVNSDAASVDCYYTTMAECQQDTRGMSAQCVPNPFYKATPAPAATTRPAHR
jgi:Tfp pilus assembly protein PilV